MNPVRRGRQRRELPWSACMRRGRGAQIVARMVRVSWGSLPASVDRQTFKSKADWSYRASASTRITDRPVTRSGSARDVEDRRPPSHRIRACPTRNRARLDRGGPFSQHALNGAS
eukprot:354727-Chlamydomonas_euryale.AAC.9